MFFSYLRHNRIEGLGLLRFSCQRFISGGKQIKFDTFLVPDRAFLEISGVDTNKFLQGVCTNDVNKLIKHGDCIATAFLTPPGRIMTDSIIYKNQQHISDGIKDSIIIEIHASLASNLEKYLNMFKMRSKVLIKKISSMQCLIVPPNGDGGVEFADVIKNKTVVDATDPRTVGMGKRFLVESNSVGLGNGEENRELYKTLRLLNGIAEGLEIVNRIPLECNLDILNYVSFTKGCYVGQELTARTKYKGLVRKRLAPFIVAKDNIERNGLGYFPSEHEHEEEFVLLGDDVATDILFDVQKKSKAKISSDASNSSTEGGDVLHSGDKLFDPPLTTSASASISASESGHHEKADAVGEIITTNGEQTLGIAMMRLSSLLSETKPNTAVFNVKNDKGTDRNVIVFRPIWWPKGTIDPATGQKFT